MIIDIDFYYKAYISELILSCKTEQFIVAKAIQIVGHI